MIKARRIKYDDIIKGKSYLLRSSAFNEHSVEDYIGEVIYKDDKTATMKIKLSHRVSGSFGDPIPYNYGISKNDIDSKWATVAIYE